MKASVLRVNGYDFLKFHVLLRFLAYTTFLHFFLSLNLLWEVFRQRGCKSAYLLGLVRTLVANENSTHIIAVSVMEPVFESSDTVSKKHTIPTSVSAIWAAVRFASVYKAIIGIYILSHQCSDTWHWDNWGFQQPCKNIVVILTPIIYSTVLKNHYKNFQTCKSTVELTPITIIQHLIALSAAFIAPTLSLHL